MENTKSTLVNGSIDMNIQTFIETYGKTCSTVISLKEKMTVFVADNGRLPTIFFMGTSADPFQESHRAAVLEAKRHFDIVIILPVYEHAFTSKKDISPFKLRIRWLRTIFADDMQVIVSDVEEFLFDSQYLIDSCGKQKASTIHVMRYLKLFFGDLELFFFLGKDTFIDVLNLKWTEGLRILDYVSFVVSDRIVPNCDLTRQQILDNCVSITPEQKAKIIFFDYELGDCVSSNIRRICVETETFEEAVQLLEGMVNVSIVTDVCAYYRLKVVIRELCQEATDLEEVIEILTIMVDRKFIFPEASELLAEMLEDEITISKIFESYGKTTFTEKKIKTSV